MPLTRCLALLAAFGTLANSLRSNSASVLIRTLLRCSARPNGGGIPLGSSASRTSPEGLVRCAHLAGVGVSSFLTPHFSQGTARRATTDHPSPLTPHSSFLIPHSSPLTPHPSPLTPHSSLLTPHSSFLIPHSSPLTPHPSLLTPHSSLLTPHSSPLTPHPSLLTPHSSLLTPHSSDLTPHSSPARAKPLRVFSRPGAWPLPGAGSRLAGVCVGRQRGFLLAGRQLAGWKPYPDGVPRNG